MWDSGFLPLLITFSSEHRKHQFFIHSMLFFQHLLGMKIKTMTICIWFHFLSLCDDAEILVSKKKKKKLLLMTIANEVCKGFGQSRLDFSWCYWILTTCSWHSFLYDVCSQVPSWIYMIFYQEKFDPFTFIYKT